MVIIQALATSRAALKLQDTMYTRVFGRVYAPSQLTLTHGTTTDWYKQDQGA